MKISSQISYMDFDILSNSDRLDYRFLLSNEDIVSEMPIYRIKDICLNNQIGKTIKGLQYKYQGDIPFIKVDNFINDSIKLTNKTTYISNTEFDQYYSLGYSRKGDVLVSIVATIGAVAKNDYGICVTNQQIVSLTLDETQVDRDYFVQVIKSKFIQDRIDGLKKISATPNMNTKDLLRFEIPLPSLEEQKRTLPFISAKIKTLEHKIKELEIKKEKYSIQNITTKIIANNYDETTIDVDNNSKCTYSYFDEDMGNYLSFNNVTHKETSKVELVPLSTILMAGEDKKVSSNPNNKKIVGLENIDSFTGKIINEDKLDDGDINSDKVIFKGNEIMFAKMRPYLSKFIIVNENNENYIGSSELFGINLQGNIKLEFVRLLLSSYYCINQYKQYYSGNGKPRISRANLFKVLIPKEMISKQDEFIKLVSDELGEVTTIKSKIKEIKSVIDNDLNKYILYGYSDSLFQLPEEVI